MRVMPATRAAFLPGSFAPKLALTLTLHRDSNLQLSAWPKLPPSPQSVQLATPRKKRACQARNSLVELWG